MNPPSSVPVPGCNAESGCSPGVSATASLWMPVRMRRPEPAHHLRGPRPVECVPHVRSLTWNSYNIPCVSQVVDVDFQH